VHDGRAHPEPIDAALMAGAGLVAGGVALVSPAEVGVTALAACGLLAVARRLRAPVAALAFFACALGLLRARDAVARHEAARAVADAVIAEPSRCSSRARVLSSPVRVRGAPRWDAHLSEARCDGAGAAWTGDATLYGGPEDLARGDEVDVVATLAPPQRFWNPAGGDPRPADARRGVTRSGGALDVHLVRRATGAFAWIDRARSRVRARIDATFPLDAGPMARALVLGESDLSPEEDRSFRASGLSHLLAVSGMHLVLVLAVAVNALGALFQRIEWCAGRIDVGRLVAATAVPVAWVYADFAGAGGSTVRAAWMATAVLFARAIGRRTDAARAFGVSLLAMGAIDPLCAYDLSFLLSAAATAGLLTFARSIEPSGPPWAAPAVRAVVTTLAASAPCIPILARVAPTLPLGGAIANVLAVPLGEAAALPLCLAHALLAGWPAAERGCAVTAAGALAGVRAIARVFSASALSVEVPPPTSWQLVTLTVALIVAALRERWRWGVLVALGGVLAILERDARAAGAPHGILRATFLDVGQGDSAIVDLPDGTAMLVDGGGLVGSPIDVGARVLVPELRARRRSTLVVAVLTHPHPDHFGGLGAALDAAPPGALWDTAQGEAEGVGGGYRSLLQSLRSRGVPIARPDSLCGERFVGGARVEVLAPCPSFSSDRGPNDNSFVLRIGYGDRAIMLVGDAEREEEALLLDGSRARLKADVLKVGHHGSRTSSSAPFLAAVAPSDAVVSVGRRNRFGHPHPEALRALAATGARVWRTDRDGAVVVTTDGRELAVQACARE